MAWNYRILAHREKEEEIYFQIHEVYYDQNGKPNGYAASPSNVSGEDEGAINWALDNMKACMQKPILWAGDRFPSEYERK